MASPNPRQVNRQFTNRQHSGNHTQFVPRGRTGILIPPKKRKDLTQLKPERTKITLYEYILNSAT